MTEKSAANRKFISGSRLYYFASLTLQKLHTSALTLQEMLHCYSCAPKNDRIVPDASKTSGGFSFSVHFSPCSSAPSISEHASQAQLLLLTNIARQRHPVVPMPSTKLSEHHFVEIRKGHSCQCFALCTCAIKKWRLCFSKR